MARVRNAQLLTLMLDAVLVEWENVLVDTGSVRRDALVRAFAEEGLEFDAARWTADCLGRPLHGAIAFALAHTGRTDDTLTDLLVLRAGRAFAERLGKGFVLVPGAREFLERLQVGTTLCIVSSSTRAETDFVLRLAGLDAMVSTITCAEATEQPGATYDRAITHLAERQQVRRHRMVAVAHVAPALRGARVAGIRTVAVGAPAHEALEADGAVRSIEGVTLPDLARIVGLITPECLS